MRVTQLMATRQFNQNINKSNQEIYNLQSQISSGKKYEKVSDNPLEVMKSMAQHSNIRQMEQYQKNVEDGRNRLTAIDDTLGSVTNVMQRVRELTVQASNDTLSDSDKKSVAAEINSLKEQLGTLANTTYNGRQLFSGMDQNTPAFQDGKIQDVGKSPMNWEIGKGISVNVNVNVNTVFGLEVDGKNLFDSLNSVVQTLDPSFETTPPTPTTPTEPVEPTNPTDPIDWDSHRANMEGFHYSLIKLASNPNSMAVRTEVIDKAKVLVEESFPQIRLQIDQLSDVDLSNTLRTQFDTLAEVTSHKMNMVHQDYMAVNMEGNAEELLFFVDKENLNSTPYNAANVIVNPILVESPEKIAASRSDVATQGTNAQEMEHVLHVSTDFGGTKTNIKHSYNQIINQLELAPIGGGELPDDGAGLALNHLWESFNKLANNPDNMMIREQLINDAQVASEAMRDITAEIDQKKQGLEEQLTGIVDEFNSTAVRVMSLNSEILIANAEYGSVPDYLVEERDLMIDKIAQLVDVEVTLNDNQTKSLNLGGTNLVDGGSYAGKILLNTGGDLLLNGAEVQLLEGTEAVGIQESLKEVNSLGYFKFMSTSLVNSVNFSHSEDGAINLNGDAENLLFFVDKNDPTLPPQDVKNIIVNPLLVESPERIAARSTNSSSADQGFVAQDIATHFTGLWQIGSTQTDILSYYQTVLDQLAMSDQEGDTANTMSRVSLMGVQQVEEGSNNLQEDNQENSQDLDNLLAAIDKQMENISLQRTIVGNNSNMLEMTANKLDQANFLSQKVLSETEGVDVAKAYMELTAHETTLNASLAVGAKMMQQSLVDFLR